MDPNYDIGDNCELFRQAERLSGLDAGPEHDKNRSK